MPQPNVSGENRAPSAVDNSDVIFPEPGGQANPPANEDLTMGAGTELPPITPGLGGQQVAPIQQEQGFDIGEFESDRNIRKKYWKVLFLKHYF